MSRFHDLINSEKPVLVDFFAEWCGPCKTMAPHLKKTKDAFGEKLSIIKIDIDRNPDAARAYQIQGVPTLILFKNGKIQWRQTGVVPAGELIKMLTTFT